MSIDARDHGAEPVDAHRSSAQSSATQVRHKILAYCFGMSVLLYLDRFALSVVQTNIKSELQLDDLQMGYITSAFFYVYALAQVPAGWFSDRCGARLTLSLYVAAWSVALIGLGTANGLWSLIVFRALLGLAQAGAYPCAGANNKRWFPVAERGLANSLVAMGGRAGNLLAVVATPYLILLVSKVAADAISPWRPVFMLYGSLGILWSVAYWRYARNAPREHPACNLAEQQLILGDGDTPPSGAVESAASDSAISGATVEKTRERRARQGIWAWFWSTTVGHILRSPTLWLMCSISILVNVGWIFLVTFLPTYFEEVHGLSKALVGWLAAVPGIASMCGGLLGGRTTDYLVKRYGLKIGRRTTGVVASAGAATLYGVALTTSDWRLLIVLFAMIGFLIDFGLGSLWAVYQDIAGGRVAAVLGFANMCGNFAAAVFSTEIGRFAKAGNWTAIFMIAASALVVNFFLWLGVNPTRKMQFDEDPAC